MIDIQKKREYQNRKSQEFRERNPGYYAAYAKKWRLNNPDKVKAYNKAHDCKRKFKRYSITEDEFNVLILEQENKCAICKVSGNDLKNGLHLDHDHSINKRRALLCGNCNTALGLFKEDITLMKSAIDYLNKYRSLSD